MDNVETDLLDMFKELIYLRRLKQAKEETVYMSKDIIEEVQFD